MLVTRMFMPIPAQFAAAVTFAAVWVTFNSKKAEIVSIRPVALIANWVGAIAGMLIYLTIYTFLLQRVFANAFGSSDANSNMLSKLFAALGGAIWEFGIWIVGASLVVLDRCNSTKVYDL